MFMEATTVSFLQPRMRRRSDKCKLSDYDAKAYLIIYLFSILIGFMALVLAFISYGARFFRGEASLALALLNVLAVAVFVWQLVRAWQTHQSRGFINITTPLVTYIHICIVVCMYFSLYFMSPDGRVYLYMYFSSDGRKDYLYLWYYIISILGHIFSTLGHVAHRIDYKKAMKEQDGVYQLVTTRHSEGNATPARNLPGSPPTNQNLAAVTVTATVEIQQARLTSLSDNGVTPTSEGSISPSLASPPPSYHSVVESQVSLPQGCAPPSYRSVMRLDSLKSTL